jgi:hypothetical protein
VHKAEKARRPAAGGPADGRRLSLSVQLITGGDFSVLAQITADALRHDPSGAWGWVAYRLFLAHSRSGVCLMHD